MARPKTKQDLLTAGEAKYRELRNIIESMSSDQQSAVFKFDGVQLGKEAHWKRDKCLRDVLIHLYEWHGLLLNWVDANLRGDSKPFLTEPYNWKTYGDMNVEIWKKHQKTSLKKSKTLLDESHKKVMSLIGSFSNAQLFSKGHLLWTGGSTLGQYCVSVTSSHYDWALKKIKAHIKTLPKR